MTKRLLSALLLSAAAALADDLVLKFDFASGSQGWLPGFTDYHLDVAELERLAEVRRLPEEIGGNRRGYYLQGMNRSDDLFMFLKRPLTTADGLEPNTVYSVTIDIKLASNAPSNAIGVGGAPGEGVYLKAGLSLLEPVTTLRGDYLGLSIDKGEQAVGGADAGIAGNIANGREPTPGLADSPFVEISRVYHHPVLIKTDYRGTLWAMVGTDSAFEGLTTLYYTEIMITLRPIRTP
ncbi:MAG: hypothetical protein SFV54_16015 [Bryobacteraceae bacterium]|nr:hypothetical protein [Bryobacteraceae bacterium]